MREISVFSNPVASPGVCGKCGSQDRDWFVDLGFELEMQKYEPSIDLPIWLDGVLYLCCDCINNLVTDVERKFTAFMQDHDVRMSFNGISIPDRTVDDSVADELSGDAESDDSIPESSIGEEPESFSLSLG